MRGRDPDNPNYRGPSHGKLKQRLEMNTKGTSNTLTSAYKDNVLVEPKVTQVGNIYPDTDSFKNRTMGRVYSDTGLSPTINCCGGGDREPKVLRIPQATKKGYEEVCQGGVFDGNYPNSTTRRGRVQEGGNICPTLTTENQPMKYETHYRIRKLTPRECFRLMDLRDSDIDKINNYRDAKGKPISNSQQYKMAGNSIVVNCLYLMFKNLFIGSDEPQDPHQLTLF